MKHQTFAEFYQSVHGHAPFPWQVRLSQRVAQGQWPKALNLPTSSGKTAVVDVWLWAHAVGLAGTPKRLYYVIDRRLLVDAVADYAEGLFSRSAMVGRVVRLRGGIGAAEDSWMLNPGGLTLVSTTLDQVGSRLLCRAYGASRWTAPVHAGLVGNDALIVIDEAHLVEPFRQTLHRIERWRGAAEATQSPWHVVTMTATPTGETGEVLTLEDEDQAHPVLSRRLLASKQARLLSGTLADFAAEAVRLRQGGAGVVGVVVNTVDTARKVHQALCGLGECLLVIGRARPVERDGLAREIMERAGTGSRAKGRAPLYVVATQTIEVGLDLDFDAMVSELAPASALRQRFGRLDRLGELGASHACVIKVAAHARWPYAKDQLDAAWQWLEARAIKAGKLGKVADVGIAAQGDAPAEPVLQAPVLGWPDLKLMFDPMVDMDITPYLHGEKRSTEAYVAWRASLDELQPEAWAEAVEAAPPSGLELMPIPLHALKRWLSGGDSSASDLESTPEPDEFETRKALPMVLRWDGENAELVKVSALRTSDTVVLPASRGGCDRFGWHPASQATVRDLFEEGLVAVPAWSGRNERTRWAIGLAEHLHGVGAKAAAFARACGLPHNLIAALEEAGRLHDLGKNDPRFQLMLGSFDGKPLAKSGSHEVAVSRKLAGLPMGWRHELGSVAQRIDIDPLVRYLVGSHHGRGRPWMPATPDPKLWQKAQAGDWPALANQLQDQHGFWGLCYLEAILRLADWARSVDEQANAEAMEEQHAA